MRKPQVAESLKSKKIVDVAVGALHCLAVTDTGQVCSVTGVSLVGHIVSVCVSLSQMLHRYVVSLLVLLKTYLFKRAF